jgi:hypothetical protein
VPAIIVNGAEWFLGMGKPNNGGTKIFSISGHVRQAGQLRDQARARPFAKLLEMAAACAAAEAEGRDSRRLVDAGAYRRRDDGDRHGLRLDRESRILPRLGRRHRDG